MVGLKAISITVIYLPIKAAVDLLLFSCIQRSSPIVDANSVKIFIYFKGVNEMKNDVDLGGLCCTTFLMIIIYLC